MRLACSILMFSSMVTMGNVYAACGGGGWKNNASKPAAVENSDVSESSLYVHGAKPLDGSRIDAMQSKLDLSKDQITKIYEVQGKYKAKIKGLQDQIAAMQTEERAAMVNVLTDPQKELLRKLATGEVKKDGDKKPVEKKPVEKGN